MVHALQKIRGLLNPSGAVIDLRPLGEPSSVEVHDGGQVTVAGQLGHRLNFGPTKAAHEAVARSVDLGLYVVEREISFDFLYHAATFSDMKRWLAEDWENAILPRETARRVEELLAGAGDEAILIVRRPVHIARLKPL